MGIICRVVPPLLWLLLHLAPQLEAVECKPGVPCIFMGKVDGWAEYKESTGPRPYPVKTDSWSRGDATIFYSISSFRDELCPRTLFNAFSKATHPMRIRIGVVQQNTAGDIDCLERYCNMMTTARNLTRAQCPHEQQITMNRQRAEDAKGPTWARAIGSTMVGDEEFCMQTDSHMDFVHNWDKNLLAAWAMTENEYAVLSTYVTAIEELPKVEDGEKGINGQHEVPHLCMITFGANQLVRNWGTKCIRNFQKPKMTNMVWGAGLSFSKCHAEKKTLYDPFTPGIFDGEEFSKAIRLWTHGYDIYSPHRVYVVHDYHKSQGNPLHSSWAGVSIPIEEKMKGIKRLETVSGLPGGIADVAERQAFLRSKYGLGDRRSIAQAVEFSGFSLHNRTTLRNRCGNLDHVPFKEHPLGADYIPRFDPITFEPLDEPDIGSIYFDPAMKIKPVAVVRPHTNAPKRLREESYRKEIPLENGVFDAIDSSKKIQNFNSGVRSSNAQAPENQMLHVLAFVAIFLCPVSLAMCCLGRCKSIASVFTGFISGEKSFRKLT